MWMILSCSFENRVIFLFSFNYLIPQHPNIKFTHEIETNNKLNFLYITVEKYDNNFKTGVYRQVFFSGLEMN